MVSGPVSILWDIENCPVPSNVRPQDVAGNIRMALRMHPVITGAVTLFSAYGDFNAFPRRLREGCQRTGVKLVDVPNGRKDAADKAILVDMFLFALDNPPPSSILLISGDVDFAPALHILGQRGYTVILVIPARVDVSSALTNAGRFVWDWPSVARGEGFVPPKYLIPRVPNLACYFSSSQIGDNTEGQYEESIVYTGISRGEYSARGNLNQMHFNSMSVVDKQWREKLTLTDIGNHDGQVHDTMEIFASKDSKGQLATSNKDEENGEKRVVAAFPLPRYLQYAGVMLLGALGGFALGFCLRSSKKEGTSKGSWKNIHDVLVGCIKYAA